MTNKSTWNSCFSLFAVFVVCLAATTNAQLDIMKGTCLSSTNSYIFNTANKSCEQCPANAVAMTGTHCTCTAGYANTFPTALGGVSLLCEACATPKKQGTDETQSRCLPCGGAADIFAALNGTAAASCAARIVSDVRTSTYDATKKQCSCGVNGGNYSLTSTFGDVKLDALVCVACSGMVPQNDPFKCIACAPPKVLLPDATCGCGTGYDLLVDGSCAWRTQLQALMSVVTNKNYAMQMVNLDNSGKNGNRISSDLLGSYLPLAAYGCANGNATACNLLANLCVLTRYDLGGPPCQVYRSLHRREVCRGVLCEIPATLPWLYYLRGSAMVLQSNKDTTLKVSLGGRRGHLRDLQFVLSSYSWNGTWLGNTEVTSQLHMCDIPGVDTLRFWRVGSDKIVRCNVNIRWFLQAPETVFHDLFIKDNSGKLQPMPVLVDYSNTDITPANIFDPILYRDMARSDEPEPNSYKRRFFTFDNMGFRQSAKGRPSAVVYARKISLLLTLRPTHDSTVYTPILIIQYATALTTGLYGTTNFDYNQLKNLRTNTTATTPHGAQTDVRYTMDTAGIDEALKIVLITFCCISFLTAWVRAYGWMRRQQDAVLGLEALIRFFLYLCNHLSFFFTATVLLTSYYWYLFYKHQSNIEYFLPHSNVYFYAMLYTATCGKGLNVIFRVLEQCNADVFVIDWERSKGPLLRGGKEVSVSMWRSTFVANEFNELQTIRAWPVLINFAMTLLFLEGLSFVRLADSVPNPTYDEPYTHSDPTLRIAILSFFFIIIAIVIFIVEHHIYMRFLSVHPLRSFIDLCSVANISVVILLENQWGWYLHGQSIHDYADQSLQEFQNNLKKEQEGNLPRRGLGGIDVCQTFELFIGSHLRQFMNVCYNELYNEMFRAQGQAGMGTTMPLPAAGPTFGLFKFLRRGLNQQVIYSSETLRMKQKLNDALKESVLIGAKAVQAKIGPHYLFDFPPNLMYMNGPYAGEGNVGRNLFFPEHDAVDGWSRTILYGIDFDIFHWYLLLFLAIDTSLQSTYVSICIVYVVDIIIVWYRGQDGQANLGDKTLFDDRFFL